MTVYEELVNKNGFSTSQKKILEIVKGGDVLEIGSSTGYMTKVFAKDNNLVDVVEVNVQSAEKASIFANKVFVGSIEDENLQKKITRKYDYVICADVLEHLVNPESVLHFLRTKLKKSGVVLISIPNIACWNMRIDLLRGKFDYQEIGLLDETHLRFYTYYSFLNLLKNCGFSIENIFPTKTKIPFEYSLLKLPIIGMIFVSLFKSLLLMKFPNLVIYHYVIQAKS